jgi:hypothetical protein
MSPETAKQFAGQAAEINTDTSATNFGGITVVNTNTLLSKPHVQQFMAALSAHTQRILSRSVNGKTRTAS